MRTDDTASEAGGGVGWGGGGAFTEIMISLLLQRPLSNHFALWLSEKEATAFCHVGRRPTSDILS